VNNFRPPISLGLLAVLAFAAAVPASAACVGELVDVGTGRAASIAELVTAASKDGVILVGERHGVEAQPRNTACILRALAETGPVDLVLEMIPSQKQSVVDGYVRQHPEVADGLGAELQWWKSGWPSWTTYEPLVDAALITRSSILAGDSDGTGKAEPERNDAAWQSAERSWAEAMKAAHCGLIDDERAAELGRVQVARDVHMAAIVMNRPQRRPAIVYAGRAHVRRDRSLRLALEAGGARVVSIGMVEDQIAGEPVQRDRTLAEAKGRYEYVWISGTAEGKDACTVGLGSKAEAAAPSATP
jgi:uncharacterized iron-regulated protein